MQNVRTHGSPPYRVAVLHGGPGAAGEVAPVARTLSASRGVLEPLQTRDSVSGQVDELREVVERYGSPPVRLVGYSWGAWLAYLFAARHPSLVDKIVLVSSGPFEESYVEGMADARLARLNEEERAELARLQVALQDREAENRDGLLARAGALFGRADAYDPIDVEEPDGTEVRMDIFEPVWSEAAELRRRGALLAAGSEIQCKVVAVHGDHDPHPAAGVQEPLERTVRRFRFVLLERCGHKPWIERWARERFYQVLESEI